MGSEAPLVLVKSARAEVKILFQLPFSSEEGGFFFRERKEERERERDKRERSDVDWSEDARAEKTERGERFVGGDREVRRYLFPTYSSEIAFERCEILARSEYGDEKVD